MYCIKVRINKLPTSMYSYSMTGAYCEIVIAICTVSVSAKTDHVYTKLKSLFIAQEHSYTQELVSPLSNVSGSAFLEGIC